MRRLTIAIVIIMGLSIGVAGTVLAAGPATGGAPVRHLVFFKNQGRMPSGHTAVVRFLQQQTARQMKAVSKVIKSAGKAEALWIANAMVLPLTAAEASDMARQPNVRAVRPVRYRRYIDVSRAFKPVVNADPVQWSVAKVGATETWSELKIDGSGIVVGHLDTGAYAAHPALAGKILAFRDFTPAAKPTCYDDQGHGSHTAGSICGGNGVGVAPGARLLVAKVFDRKGSAEDAWLFAAMQWVMDPDGNPDTNDGPKLVNNSWGSDDSADLSFVPAVDAWVAAGIVPVFAAGNAGPSGKVGTPAAFPQSWAVAATTKDDRLAYFSSVGPVTWNGQPLTKPDIAAPGYGVISCSHTGNGLVSNMGTSMACPHVAGLAALMLQANPGLTIDQVRQLCEETATDLGVAGKDNKFGSGRFNALPAVKKALSLLPPTATSLFACYDAILTAERALVGVQAVSPLAAPFARSLACRALSLDDAAFAATAAEIEARGSAAARVLLREIRAARRSEALHR